MSSEWWPVLAVFWGLYLADGLRGGRRDRLFFYHWTGYAKLRARFTQATWFLIPPSSDAWTIVADDLPASLAPEGLTNWPSVSAARPPPLPDAIRVFRWEEIQRVEDRAGWIYINGHRFAPVTPGLTANSLGTLARELAPLNLEMRAARLRIWQTGRFCSARLKRRMQAVLLRSRSLVFLNTVQVTILAIVSAYLLFDGPARLSPELRDAIADRLPVFLIVCAGLHLLALVGFYRLHRRIYPRAGQELASILFTALFVPPQALRLRLHLTSKLAAGLHPMTVALACARPAVARAVATDTLRDLHWPRRPVTLPASVDQLVRSSASLLKPIMLEALGRQSAAFSPDSLLAPPTCESPQACAYCPRCGDEFTRLDSRCPHGVPLARL